MKLNPETTYQAVVGRVIVRMRKELGVEQLALSEALGVNQSTWSRIERGESALNVEQLIKAAERLQVKPHIILMETETALAELEIKGVSINTSKAIEKKSKDGIALIGAAALGGLVGAAIAKATSSNQTKPDND